MRNGTEHAGLRFQPEGLVGGPCKSLTSGKRETRVSAVKGEKEARNCPA